jgi:hypothetical protein
MESAGLLRFLDFGRETLGIPFFSQRGESLQLLIREGVFDLLRRLGMVPNPLWSASIGRSCQFIGLCIALGSILIEKDRVQSPLAGLIKGRTTGVSVQVCNDVRNLVLELLRILFEHTQCRT